MPDGAPNKAGPMIIVFDVESLIFDDRAARAGKLLEAVSEHGDHTVQIWSVGDAGTKLAIEDWLQEHAPAAVGYVDIQVVGGENGLPDLGRLMARHGTPDIVISSSSDLCEALSDTGALILEPV